jgi:hypothetical protein
LNRFGKVGWEAGIRTPIPWSRATCPTVGRPPSVSRGASQRQELAIIANPKQDRQAQRLSPGRPSSGSRLTARSRFRTAIPLEILRYLRTLRQAVAAVASGDDWPCRPCVRLHALLHSSTREPYPSDARPCHPCSRSLAVCFDPLTQIHDPLLPPCPPHPRRSRFARAAVPRGTSQNTRAATDVPRLQPQPSSVQGLRKRFSGRADPAQPYEGKACPPGGQTVLPQQLGPMKKEGTIRNGSAQPTQPRPEDGSARRFGQSARGRRIIRGLPTFPLWRPLRHG